MIRLPQDACAGVDIQCGLTATMRDGCRLVADVYRPFPTPAQPGPWPVLLMRQPYGRDIASTVVYAHPTWYARRGFIVVIQDVRGRGDSEGSFYAFRNEIEDGYDTVRWAARLPGSNGRVGMYGFSYQGSTQLLAALARPPELRALAPHMTAFDLDTGWFYRGGLLQLSTTLNWANQMLREDSRRLGAREAERLLDESYQNTGRLSGLLPVRDASPIVREDLPSYGADWIRNPSGSAYWKEFNLLDRISELGLPMFHISGWYDLYLRGSVDGYRAMARQHGGQFLLASPWVHIPWGNLIGGADLGSAAVPDIDDLQARWFHHWLDTDAPGPIPPELSGCRYFCLGENAWRTSSTWPPPEAKPQTWFLCSNGRANSRFGDGRLSEEAATGPDDLYNYDPEVPVVAPGGNQGGHALFGPHDLSAQQQGINLLVFDTPPFSAPCIVAADPVCVLHVTTTAPETSFVARLSRVTRDGKAIFLSLGAVRAAPRPGEAVRIILDPLAVRLDAGERLRLDVSSSAFPLLIRHPNTLADPAAVSRPAEFRRALQVVHHDSTRPSRLEITCLPVSA
jgi:putative CocE/NonD family hydrolase